MVKRQFLTPPTLPETTIERCLVIPYSKEWLGIFNDALLELAQSYNYEQVNETDMTPEDVANICFDIYLQYLEGACGMNCSELLACLDNRQTRINPDTGQYQVSYDGGETWQDAPELDPRVSSAPFAPVAGDCDGANAIVGFAQRWIEEQTDVLDVSSTIFAVAGVLASLAAFVFSGGLALPLLISAATVAVTQGRTAILAAMTAGVWEDFRCIVFCAIGSSTEVTQEIFDEIVDGVNATFTLAAHAMLASFVQTMGPVGLQNASVYGLAAAGIPESCTGCGCAFCNYINLGTSNGGFVAEGANQGVWTNGIGWQGQNFAAQSNKYLGIIRTFTATEITRIAIVFDKPSGSGVNNSASIRGYNGASLVINQNYGTGVGLNLALEWTGSQVIDKIAVYLNAGSSGGNVTLEEITIEGVGTSPFGESNC